MSDRKKSRYATKRDSGKQVYGPGCCAHSVSASAIERCKAEARELRHYAWTLENDGEYERRRAKLDAERERNKRHAA